MLLQSLQQFPGENHSIPITSPSALAAADMTVLERQIARLHWQQQQRQLQPQQQEPPPPPSYFAATIAADISLVSAPYSIPQPPQMLPSSAVGLHNTNFCGEQDMISHDLSTGSGGVWPHLTNYPLLCNSSPRGGGVTGGRGAISRTFSCPQTSQLEHSSTAKDGAAAAAVAAALSTDRTRESSKKRKAAERDGTHKLKENDREKKVIKVENTNTLVEPKLESPSIMSSSTAITTNNCNDNNREASSSASKEQPKAPEPAPMTDYIHVRARRGQATDSHSLAERVRREKISDRMKLLQDLVPGCNKITGKAGMLDEIINYVQSLQRQVEFLSMKLAAVTPALDFNPDALLAEISMLAGDGGILAQLGLSPELLGLSFLQFNPLQQQALAAAAATDCCSLPLPMASSCGPTEVPVCSFAATPGPATESCSFPNTRNILVPSPPSTTSGWEGDLQRFYNTMEEFEQVRGSFTAC